MKHKENNIIQEFINGTLDDKSRLMIRKNFNSLNKSVEEETTENNSNKFDADTAWTNLHNRIKKNSIKGKTYYKFGRIAASVILLIGLSVSGYYVFTPNSTRKVQSEDSIKTITLPDGSVVTLNTNSHISYPEKFTKNNRTVKFEGEAFFNIRKNPLKPFIIETDKARIKVLGTSFNVNTENKKTEVVVKTGKVELKNTRKKQNKVILIPGEKGISDAKNIYKQKNNNPNYLSWKTHFFTYNNEKLKNIVSDINKTYQINIVFKNAEIGEIITGKTSFNNYNIDTIVKIICETHHLHSKIDGKNIILSY